MNFAGFVLVFGQSMGKKLEATIIVTNMRR